MTVSIPIAKKNEQLFFLSYVVFLSFSILTHSFYYRYFAGLYKPIVLLSILLLVAQEITNRKLSIRAGVGAIILFLVTFYLIFHGHGDLQVAFACIFVFTFCARNIDFKKIGRVTVTVTLIIITGVIFSSLLGIIPNYHAVNGLRSRYYLGFRYALNAPAFFFNVVLLETYIKGAKIKVHHIALLTIGAWALYKATDSRLSFYLSILCIAIALINVIRKDDFKELKLVPRLLVPFFIICFAVSFWLTATYSSGVHWMKELNAILGGRLRIGQASLLTYGINLFGVDNLEWIGNGLDMYGKKKSGTYLYVDNLYIQVLQRYGIIFIVLFLLLTTVLMYQCYKKKENLLSLMLALVAAHGLIDDSGLYLHFNSFWILFGPAAFGYLRQIKDNNIDKKRHIRIR